MNNSARFWLSIIAVSLLELVHAASATEVVNDKADAAAISPASQTGPQTQRDEQAVGSGNSTASSKFSPASDEEIRSMVAQWTKRLTQSPHDTETLIKRGMAFHALGEFDKGKSDLALAIKVAPSDPQTWSASGRGFLLRGMPKRALKAFDKAIALGASDARLQMNRAAAYEALDDHQSAIACYAAAIEADPNSADAHVYRAKQWNHLGDWNKAVADLNRAIELDPKSPCHRAARGMLYFDKRQYDNAIAEFLKAIELNPDDLGNDYRPTSDKALSPESLAHGEEQVRQMLKDRPAMAQHVTPGDKIWTWAVRKFAGEDVGAPVDWDRTSPEPYGGESGGATNGKHSYIRVWETASEAHKDASAAFEELWVIAVFELLNVNSVERWNELDRHVAQGKFRRNEYILAKLNSEERAKQQTRSYYVKYFLPWLLSKNIVPSDPRRWYVDDFFCVGDPQTDQALWKHDRRWPYYSAAYDLLRIHRAYERGDLENARARLQKLFAQERPLAGDQLASAHYMMGLVSGSMGKFDQAIKEFDAALAIVPDYEQAILGRGVARRNSGSTGMAIEDFTRVIEINPSADAYRWRGVAWSNQGQSDNALQDFDRAIRIDPGNVAALTTRAMEHAQRGDFDAALRDSSAAIRLQPQNAETYGVQANILMDKRDYTKAVEDYSRAIEFASEDARGYQGRASAWYNQGELENALADWNIVCRLKPLHSTGYVERGNVYFLKKMYREALADYSQAINLAPDDPSGYAARAELLLESEVPDFRRPTEALKDALRSCELTKWESPYELSLLASAHAANEDFKNAVRWQKQAVLLSENEDRRNRIEVLQTYKSIQYKHDAKP